MEFAENTGKKLAAEATVKINLKEKHQHLLEQQHARAPLPVIPGVFKAKEPPVKFEMPDQKISHTWKEMRTFENNVILIKPEFDASNKQVFAKNKFRSNHERLMIFFEPNSKEQGLTNLFQPKMLGDMGTGTSMGALLNATQHRSDPDFYLRYELDKGKKKRYTNLGPGEAAAQEGPKNPLDEALNMANIRLRQSHDPRSKKVPLDKEKEEPPRKVPTMLKDLLEENDDKEEP